MKVASIKGLIFDIDGVLEFQGVPYPAAIQTIQALRQKGLQLRFLTNSTLNSRRSRAEKLRRLGFHILDEEVFTASYLTARYLEQIQPRSCWVLVARNGIEEFEHILQDEENPEYVVVGDFRERFNFANLNKALRLLANGANLIGMQGELLDNSMGDLELNVGAWVELLARASGKAAIYIGKPAPYGFDMALRSMGIAKDQVLVAGDRIETDILGARNFGLRSLLVKTGEFRPQDLLGEIQPDYVCASIQDIPALLF